MERVLGAAALVGGSIWIGLRFFSPDWGPPGTSAYLGYELWNRFWAPALALMAAGFVGLWRDPRYAVSQVGRVGLAFLVAGLAIMAAGNAAEFWVFTNIPYGGDGPTPRDLSWMSFLIGSLLALIGATVAGNAMAAGHFVPGWLSTALAIVLPATLLIGLVDMGWAGVPLGAAAIATGVRGASIGARDTTGAQPA